MDLAALQRFLSRQGVEVRGELRVELISGGRSNLTFTAADDGSAGWCAARRSAGSRPPRTTWPASTRVTSRLQDTGVPGGATVAFDADGPRWARR